MLDCVVSPAIAKCSRMIYQKALQTYKRIPAENRRYTDLEDLLQEGLIAAWRIEKSYNPDKGTKFSTYLFNGLDQIYSNKLTPFRQKKRFSVGMLELDAPRRVNFDSGFSGAMSQHLPTFEAVLKDSAVPASIVQEAIDVLLTVFRAADEKVQRMLLEVAAGSWRVYPRRFNLAQRLRRLSKLHNVVERDYNLLCSNADVKTQVIEGMSRLTNIEAADARLLLCGECGKLFSLTDVREGRYVASSLACTACLKQFQNKPVNTTCFGKPKMIQDGRTLQQGFSESNAACRLHCLDRVACENFAGRKVTRMTGEPETVLDGIPLEDVDVSKAAPKVTAKTSTKKAGIKLVDKTAKDHPAKAKSKAKVAAKSKVATKSKAKAKVVAKAKEKAATGEKKVRKQRVQKSAKMIDPHSPRGKELIKANLDEKGRDLPFKNPSWLRQNLIHALKPGRTLKAMEAFIEAEGGGDPAFQLAVLRSGKSGGTSLRPYPTTHTWTVMENDGLFHIPKVKRIACYERMARIDRK